MKCCLINKLIVTVTTIMIHSIHHIDGIRDTARQRLGKHHLKAGIVKSERTSITEKRLRIDVPAATNSYERAFAR
jgi:hypothetical protein